MKKTPKFWHLSWSTYGAMAESLAKTIKSKRRKYDLVIGIARGGVPLAMVVADEIDAKIDIINVKSYTGIAKRTKPRILSTLTNNVRGKRILVVDDLIDEGDTMKTILKYLSRMGPARMETAALFDKPWSKFKPDFRLKTVDTWVIFPWSKGEFSRTNK